jgi:hypothetical protein
MGVKGGRVLRLTTIPPSAVQLSEENTGASMSHGLLQGWLYYLLPIAYLLTTYLTTLSVVQTLQRLVVE